MKPRGAPRTDRSGCGLLFAACAVTCLLLLANRVVVTSLYAVVVPSRFDYDRLRVLLQFMFMAGLLLPEWWLIDRLAQFVRSWLLPLDSTGADDTQR